MAVLRSVMQGLKNALLFCALAGFLLPAAFAQDAGKLQLQEHKIKAGLMYNFLKYTTWPAAQPSVHICLFGGDSFDGFLNPLQGRTAKQAVIKISRINTLAQSADCNLVFIHASQQNNLAKILRHFEGKPVLTASDIPQFSRLGGMVELSMQADKRIHLFINRKTLDRAGLTIEERLANLAETVP